MKRFQPSVLYSVLIYSDILSPLPFVFVPLPFAFTFHELKLSQVGNALLKCIGIHFHKECLHTTRFGGSEEFFPVNNSFADRHLLFISRPVG
jgi:hypothetical protein